MSRVRGRILSGLIGLAYSRLRLRMRVLFLKIVVALCVFLAAGETGLRIAAPYADFGAGLELDFRGHGEARSRLYTEDAELGFRPVLDSTLYNAVGTLRNDYPLQQTAGTTRILLLGDSVTHRGALVDGLRAQWGDDGVEYWNAGVESYNTAQQWAYYRRYQAALEPDVAILTLHVNDFMATPVVFRNRDGELVVYATHRRRAQVSGPLFRWSYIYRIWLGLRSSDAGDFDARMADVRGALRAMRDHFAGHGTAFQVMIFPVLKPRAEWSEGELRAHAAAGNLLEALEIAYVDLWPFARDGLAAGHDVQETPGDLWHPSAAFGQAVAERIARDEPGRLAVDRSAGVPYAPAADGRRVRPTGRATP